MTVGVRSATLAGAALAVGLFAGCSAPTHQLVEAGDTRFTFEVPAEFVDLDPDDGLLYGPAGSAVGTAGSDPVVRISTASNGSQHSFLTLRSAATGGRYDPLDPELAGDLPDGTVVEGYEEILEPEIWGVHMLLSIDGRIVVDYQAVVDRRTDQLAITEVTCTLACYLDQSALIDEIQSSWNLES